MKEILDKLKECTARHTELITVYIPSGFNLNQVVKQLEYERGTASNIKSNATRKNVLLALEKCIRILREYGRTPKNGLALYVGMVNGKSELKCWHMEPPKPLRQRLYRCDKEFVLKPMYELIIDSSYYLLVVVENGDCSIGTYSNGYVSLRKRLKTLIPSDNKKGGQSSQRFERIRRELKKGFLKKVAEFINNEFLFDKKLKGIVLGGTFVTVDEFKRSKQINTQLKEKIVCVKNISSDGLKGLEELSIKAMDDIANSEIIEKENIVDKFFKNLAINPDSVVYGETDVLEMITANRVSHIITCNPEFEFEKKTVVDDSIRRYHEIVGLGGTLAFLHY